MLWRGEGSGLLHYFHKWIDEALADELYSSTPLVDRGWASPIEPELASGQPTLETKWVMGAQAH